MPKLDFNKVALKSIFSEHLFLRHLWRAASVYFKAEVYLKPCQAYMIDLLAQISNDI